MKTQIVNYIQNILGINALKIRIETDDTLIAVLRKQVAELVKAMTCEVNNCNKSQPTLPVA